MTALLFSLALCQVSPSFLLEDTQTVDLPWSWEPFRARAGEREQRMGPWFVHFNETAQLYYQAKNAAPSGDVAYGHHFYRPGWRRSVRVSPNGEVVGEPAVLRLSLDAWKGANDPPPTLSKGFRTWVELDHWWGSYWDRFQPGEPVALSDRGPAWLSLGIAQRWLDGGSLPLGKHWFAEAPVTEQGCPLTPAIPADFQPGERILDAWAHGSELRLATARIEGNEMVFDGWRFTGGKFVRWLPDGFGAHPVRLPAVPQTDAYTGGPSKFAPPDRLVRVSKHWWALCTRAQILVNLSSGSRLQVTNVYASSFAFVPIGERLFLFPRTQEVDEPYRAFELDLQTGKRTPVTTPYRIHCRSSRSDRWFVENVDTRWIGIAKVGLARPKDGVR